MPYVWLQQQGEKSILGSFDHFRSRSMCLVDRGNKSTRTKLLQNSCVVLCCSSSWLLWESKTSIQPVQMLPSDYSCFSTHLIWTLQASISKMKRLLAYGNASINGDTIQPCILYITFSSFADKAAMYVGWSLLNILFKRICLACKAAHKVTKNVLKSKEQANLGNICCRVQSFDCIGHMSCYF